MGTVLRRILFFELDWIEMLFLCAALAVYIGYR